MRNRLLVLSLVPTLLASGAVTAAHADEVVSDDLTAGTPIAARSGTVAWSRYDEATSRYQLVLQRPPSAPSDAPIDGMVRPFDISMGSDRRGRSVALYSRCAADGRHCDIYRYNLASAGEQKISSVSGPTEDEALPVQDANLLAFVRRGSRAGPNAEVGDCDRIFVKNLASPAPSRRLDRDSCAPTTGLSLRGSRVVRTTLVQGDDLSESEVRLLSTRGGVAKVLAYEPDDDDHYTEFESPNQSASSIWLTRTGGYPPPSFVRLDIATGRMTEVRAGLELTGALARDEHGTFWYGETPLPFSYFSVAGLAIPRRLIRASPSPFSSSERTLPPELAISPSEDIRATFGDPLIVSGRLARAVVRRGRPVRTQAIAGAAVRLLRRIGNSPQPDVGEHFVPTALTALTDADGDWSIPIESPASRPWYSAVTEGQPARTFAGRGTNGRVNARLALSIAGGSSTGTVMPAQPGRTVAIQRLSERTCRTAGRSERSCRTAVGTQGYYDDVWTTVASVPLDAAGTHFTATLASVPAGIYTVLLPAVDQASDPDAYEGRSPEVSSG